MDRKNLSVSGEKLLGVFIKNQSLSWEGAFDALNGLLHDERQDGIRKCTDLLDAEIAQWQKRRRRQPTNAEVIDQLLTLRSQLVRLEVMTWISATKAKKVAAEPIRRRRR